VLGFLLQPLALGSVLIQRLFVLRGSRVKSFRVLRLLLDGLGMGFLLLTMLTDRLGVLVQRLLVLMGSLGVSSRGRRMPFLSLVISLGRRCLAIVVLLTLSSLALSILHLTRLRTSPTSTAAAASLTSPATLVRWSRCRARRSPLLLRTLLLLLVLWLLLLLLSCPSLLLMALWLMLGRPSLLLMALWLMLGRPCLLVSRRGAGVMGGMATTRLLALVRDS